MIIFMKMYNKDHLPTNMFIKDYQGRNDNIQPLLLEIPRRKEDGN